MRADVFQALSPLGKRIFEMSFFMSRLLGFLLTQGHAFGDPVEVKAHHESQCHDDPSKFRIALKDGPDEA